MDRLLRRFRFPSLAIILALSAGTAPAQPGSKEATPPTNSKFHESGEPGPATPPTDPRARYKLDTGSLIYNRVTDDSFLKTSGENGAEFQAYNATIIKAHQFTAAELEAVARRDLKFADLIRPIRKDYQFDLVYLEGRLVRLRQFVPEQPVRDAGIEIVYEGWMFPQDGSDPVCVLTTELPEGLTVPVPPRDFVPAKNVRVAGYFFKLFWYESGKSDVDNPGKNRFLKAPLIMAKSFSLIPEPERQPSSFWLGEFLPGLLLFLGVLTIILFSLNWYFRSGDRRLAAEREARYARNNPFPDDNNFTIPERT